LHRPKIFCGRYEYIDFRAAWMAAFHPLLPISAQYRMDCSRPFSDIRPYSRHRRQHRALMLAVLGRLADVERDLIRTRTAEGRSRATSSSNVSYITLAEIKV